MKAANYRLCLRKSRLSSTLCTKKIAYQQIRANCKSAMFASLHIVQFFFSCERNLFSIVSVLLLCFDYE